MSRYNHSLALDATIMVSKNCPIIGEHVVRKFFYIIWKRNCLKIFKFIWNLIRDYIEYGLINIIESQVKKQKLSSVSGAIIRDGDSKSWDPRGPMIWDNFSIFRTNCAILTSYIRANPRTCRGFSRECCHVARSKIVRVASFHSE